MVRLAIAHELLKDGAGDRVRTREVQFGKWILIANKGLICSRRSSLSALDSWHALNEVIKVTRFREVSRHPSSFHLRPLLVDMILLWTSGPPNDSRIRTRQPSKADSVCT